MARPDTQTATRRRSGRGPAAATGSARLGSYLRQLREGYGYTLRKVEESAVALGESIDNSQLSRFEKGKAVPSFEKLRALARVFNVPVQSFSDVLDLEEFQHLKPETRNFEHLLREGAESFSRGETGRAFVTYERALEVADAVEDARLRAERSAEARWRMACALKALGKLFMTEQELRSILKQRHRLQPKTRMRTLLQLGYLYRELGDLYLAAVLMRECLQLADEVGDRATEAGVWNALGNIRHDEERIADAEEAYRKATDLLETSDDQHEMKATVMTNLGGCLVASGRFDEGVELLRAAYGRALHGGFRRAAALALTRLAEAWDGHGDRRQARDLLSESDALASRPEGCFHDILFLNAFHRWKMAREETNGTGEKIAFGRLRHIRSLLQRKFPEVDEFDRHVERNRR